MQRGKGGLRRGRYESDVAEARREATSLLGTKVGESRQSQVEQQVSGFYRDIREGIISPEQTCLQQGKQECDNGDCIETWQTCGGG